MSNNINVIDRFFSLIKVTEKNNIVVVSGLMAEKLIEDISSYWGTNRINKWFFNTIGTTHLSYHSFFNSDFYYIITTLLNDQSNWRISKTTLRIILEELKKNTSLSKLEKPFESIFNYNNLDVLFKKPLPHQNLFFKNYEIGKQRHELNGALLASAPGTGKTLSSIMLALLLNAEYCFMIVPKISIEDVWLKTIKTEFKEEQSVWSTLSEKPYNNEKWIIIHYESIGMALEIYESIESDNCFIGLDESHNLNEITSLRTELFLQLVQISHCKNVLWSSGTPIKAMGYEAIPLLRSIDSLFNKDVEERFKKIYSSSSGRANEILNNRMNIISTRIEKTPIKETEETIKIKIPNGNDYLLETIKKEMRTFVNERLEYYQKNKQQYEKMFYDCLNYHEKNLISAEQKKNFAIYKNSIEKITKTKQLSLVKEEIIFCNKYEKKVIVPSLRDKTQRDEFKNSKSVVKYVYLKVMGEALGKVLTQKRIQCHLDMIPFMELEKIIPKAAKKTLIFTSFVNVVDKTYDYLKEKGFEPLVVYGDTNKDISLIVKKFEVDPRINPLIATYRSLSTAIPLVMANQTITLNHPFRDYEMQQAKARTSRLGQDMPTHFVDIVLDTGDKDNISTRGKDILEWSKQQVAEIMGDLQNEDFEEVIVSLEEHYNELTQEYSINN